MKSLVIMFIKGYQNFISPVLPKSCRFIPTCSEYTVMAIKKYGVITGGFKAVKRVCKCHPFNVGGYDPVD